MHFTACYFAMQLCFILCLWLTTVLSDVTKDRESRLVHIESGPVRGYKDREENVFIFRGIPYATAPTGDQRFKAPLPAPVWCDIFEAVDEDTVCPQFKNRFLPESKIMKENCLIANVYVPGSESESNANTPVVVYIHGGGFGIGFGDFITPKKLVSSQNVIAITFNYRLGAHGYLCLGTEDVPGNAGMKDQVALLRWVKKNIASFGGNPDDVTIAGYSAGSMSVNLLMISKMTESLFNKVIAESGSILSPHTVQVDPIQNAKEYAELMGFSDLDNVSDLEKKFKNASYELLQSVNILNRNDISVLASPCIERDNGQEMFLKENPVKILEQGKYPIIPILLGFTSLEGLTRLPIYYNLKEKMNSNFENFLPADLNFRTKEEKHLIATKIRKFYFEDKSIDDNTVLGYVLFITDVAIACPTLRSVKHYIKSGHNELYLYMYSYTEEKTPVVPNTKVRGANHCSQTYAVLDGVDVSISNEPYDSDDFEKMIVVMRALWGSFIKNGKPSASGVPEWKPVGLNMSPYMNLKNNSELMESYLQERCLFWNEIYDSYYKFPMPPPDSKPLHTEL